MTSTPAVYFTIYPCRSALGEASLPPLGWTLWGRSFLGAIGRHALTSPYVHHALPTFSALHLASVSQPTKQLFSFPPGSSAPKLWAGVQSDTVTALTHRVHALAQLREALDSFSETTCEAVLTASALLLASAWAVPLADRTTGIGGVV